MPPSYKLASHTTNASQRRELAWGAAWRITAWGGCMGAVLGGIFGGVLLSGNGGSLVEVGLLAGAVAGSALGLVEGVIIGVVLALLIRRTPRMRVEDYQTMARRAGITGVAIVCLLLVIWAVTATGASNPLDWLVGSSILFLLNAAAAWAAGTRVAAWMVRATEAHASAGD